MALPVSRNRTYAIGDPVASADLNDFQDQIIALQGGRHGDRFLNLSAAAFIANPELPQSNYSSVSSGSSSSINSGWRSDSNASYSAEASIRLLVGDRIKSITFFLQEPNADGEQVLVRIWEVNPLAAVSPVQKGPTKTSGITGARSQISFAEPDVDFPLIIAHRRLYNLSATFQLTSPDSEAILIGAEVVYDHPI